MSNTKHAFLILGGTGGIGSETARQLRRAGHTLFLAARTEEPLRSLSTELDASWQVCDARAIGQTERCRFADLLAVAAGK